MRVQPPAGPFVKGPLLYRLSDAMAETFGVQQGGRLLRKFCGKLWSVKRSTFSKVCLFCSSEHDLRTFNPYKTYYRHNSKKGNSYTCTNHYFKIHPLSAFNHQVLLYFLHVNLLSLFSITQR